MATKKAKTIDEVKNQAEAVKNQAPVGYMTLSVTPTDFFTGDDMETKVVYLSKPKNKTISSAMAYLTPKFEGDVPDMIQAGLIILNECFVGGDRDILTDDDYSRTASMKLVTLINIGDAELKKN